MLCWVVNPAIYCAELTSTCSTVSACASAGQEEGQASSGDEDEDQQLAAAAGRESFDSEEDEVEFAQARQQGGTQPSTSARPLQPPAAPMTASLSAAYDMRKRCGLSVNCEITTLHSLTNAMQHAQHATLHQAWTTRQADYVHVILGLW